MTLPTKEYKSEKRSIITEKSDGNKTEKDINAELVECKKENFNDVKQKGTIFANKVDNEFMRSSKRLHIKKKSCKEFEDSDKIERKSKSYRYDKDDCDEKGKDIDDLKYKKYDNREIDKNKNKRKETTYNKKEKKVREYPSSEEESSVSRCSDVSNDYDNSEDDCFDENYSNKDYNKKDSKKSKERNCSSKSEDEFPEFPKNTISKKSNKNRKVNFNSRTNHNNSHILNDSDDSCNDSDDTEKEIFNNQKNFFLEQRRKCQYKLRNCPE